MPWREVFRIRRAAVRDLELDAPGSLCTRACRARSDVDSITCDRSGFLPVLGSAGIDELVHDLHPVDRDPELRSIIKRSLRVLWHG